MSTYSGTTYFAAKTFLAGGRAKLWRPISENGYLGTQSDGSVSLVLHQTAIITYHADDTYTLFHNGWTTVTTQRWISGYTPFRIGSTYDRKYPGWSLGDSGQRTPARVQKCRTCKGEGGWVQRPHCSGAPWYSYGPDKKVTCEGRQVKYALDYYGTVTWDEYRASSYVESCEHGPAFEERHRITLCEHGSRDAHDYGEIYADECRRCSGQGRVDYGSQVIPIVWESGAVRMTADRKILDMNAQRYSPPPKVGIPRPVKWVPEYVIAGHPSLR